ncbi:uncharacterized protein [Littorina saxatilis]|uniref:uncharacterized protein isoform X2 n=1 Tax=Littorina saxatilis TaxID=31220 RepID=UPI0038B66D69
MRPTSGASSESPKFSFTLDRLDPNRKESLAESRLSSESPNQVPCSRDRPDPSRKEILAESRLSSESPNQVSCSRDRPDPNRSLPERLEGLALDQIPPNTRKVGASYSSTTFHYNRRQAQMQCRLSEERKRQQGSWSSPLQLTPTKGNWNVIYPDNLGDSTSFKMSMMGNACSLGVVEEDSDEEPEPYWQDCVKPDMMEQEKLCTPNRRRSAISSLTSQHNKHCPCSHCVGRESMSTTPTSLRSSSLSHYLPGRSLNRVQSNSSCDDTAPSAASYH